MLSRINRAFRIAATVLLMLMAVDVAMAQTAAPILQRGAQWTSRPIAPESLWLALSERPRASGWQPGDELREVPRRTRLPREARPAPVSAGVDALAVHQQAFDRQRGPATFAAVIANFDALSATGFTPGDPVVEVGTTHVIQATNGTGGTTYQIFTKDGSSAAGPFTLDALGSGPCASGGGDPIVLFDELARRWLLTEFTSATNDLCIYVSEVEDPTIAQVWKRYSLLAPNFPDYPKYGVWSDAYYLGTNEGVAGQTTFYALNRIAMLEGRAMTVQRFIAPDLAGFGFQVMQPLDLDGQFPPPPDAPGLFVRHNDAEAHRGGVGADLVELFELDVDWDVSANSLLSGPIPFSVSEFDSNLFNLTSFRAFPQPNGTLLDPLREQVMHRAVYRRFASHEAIVGNFVTDIDGNDTGGVRWFELRRSGGPWVLHQEGTWAGEGATHDGADRWMAASAMDEAGHIAMAYSVTRQAPAIHPGLRFVGRLAADPVNVMTTGEQSLVEGGSSQSGSTRWGDYHAMSVDPADGCTFWFTGVYLPTSAWETRIGAFRFNECAPPRVLLSASPQVVELCRDGPLQASTLNVVASGGFSSDVDLNVGALPAGISAGFTVDPVASTGTSSVSFAAAASAEYGRHLIDIDASGEGQLRRTQLLAVVGGDATTLMSPVDGASFLSTMPTLSWTPMAVASSYALEVATDAGFTQVVYARSTTNPVHPIDVPLANDTAHFWRVGVIDHCGNSAWSTTFRFTTAPAPNQCPAGQAATILFDDPIEPALAGWTATALPTNVATTWAVSTARPKSPTRAWFASDSARNAELRLDTPSIVVPGGSHRVLFSFSHAYRLEARSATECWDGAVLDLSTDNGSTFAAIAEDAFIIGGYARTIHGNITNNPLANRRAWCGESPAHAMVRMDLGQHAGQTLKLRFRLGTDPAGALEGWHVDDVRVLSCAAGTASTTSLSTSNNPSVFGQSTTLTAVVAGAMGTPTGSIEFLDGASVLGAATLIGGVATMATTALDAGMHALNAVYSGDSIYIASSGSATHLVHKASTDLVIADAPDPSMQAEAVTVTASITPVAPGTGTPTGVVVVTATDSAGCTLTIPAENSCMLSFTGPGLQTIGASYAGDDNFAATTAASLSHSADPENAIFRDGFEQ